MVADNKKSSLSGSKLVTVLSHLEKDDIKKLRKFLTSPYFNVSGELTSLFDLLVREMIKAQPVFSKVDLWRRLQPGKPYNDVRFRKYCSDLYKLLEAYLIQEELNLDVTEQTLLLLRAVEKRKLKKLSQSFVTNPDQWINLEGLESSKLYLKRFLFELSLYNLAEYELKRDEISNIEALSHTLDIFFLVEKLRHICSSLSRTLVVHDYHIELKDSIVHYLRNNPKYLEIPLVAAHFSIFLMLTEEHEESHYINLRNLLMYHALSFDQKEAAYMYTFALNYCSRKINVGRKSFVEEMFLVYKDSIEKKILIEDNILNPGHFKNVITVALRLKKYEWTKSFIYEYSQYLPEGSRDNAVTYNLATLYFYQQDYEKVLELLREVEYEDTTYNLNAKTMLLATYYELDEIEALFSLFDSFRAYLNRHKEIPESHKRYFKNLIKYTKKLTGLHAGDEQGIAKLKQEIEVNKAVASLNWLLEKIAELEGKPVGS